VSSVIKDLEHGRQFLETLFIEKEKYYVDRAFKISSVRFILCFKGMKILCKPWDRKTVRNGPCGVLTNRYKDMIMK
jgi:hypothetical protein